MTSSLQLMDKQVIMKFMKLYTINMFTMCYKATEASKNMTLSEFWETEYSILDCVKLSGGSYREGKKAQPSH